jgi:serpin B
MKLMPFLVPGFILIAAATAVSDKEDPVNPFEARVIQEEMKDVAASVTESNNRFALDLYGAVRGQEGNLFLSPYSISTALAMTYAGAAGATEREMAQVLRFTLDQDQVHPACGALISSLNRGSEMDGYDLLVANALWPQRGYEFLQSYLSIPKDHYDAILEALDYGRDPESARVRINSWAEEKTNQRIRNLLPPGSVDPTTRLVLTNAIYFKGKWDHEFNPDRTRPGPFRLADGSEVEVPMMHQKRTFKLGRADGLSILGMPYKGRDLSMLILLPDSVDGLAELEQRLTYEDLTGWISSLRGEKVNVTIPKFKMTSSFGLNDVLAGMGMSSAFRADAADFSKMTGKKDLFISAVVHKAFVEVNEEGTEAAAATGVVMTLSAVSQDRVFVADHPFLFLIRDDVTGSILFMGRVTDPRS